MRLTPPPISPSRSPKRKMRDDDGDGPDTIGKRVTEMGLGVKVGAEGKRIVEEEDQGLVSEEAIMDTEEQE